jgi:PAS domain S-box-containing protein
MKKSTVVGYNLFQSFINSTREMMWSVDRDYNLVISNQTFDETLGRMFSNPAGNGSEDLGNRLHFTTLYDRAFSGETFKAVEYLEKPFDRWLEISYYPILNDDEITGVACCAHDISAIKKEGDRLKLLESVVTNATDAILITKARTLDETVPRIVYVNNALLKMTGYSQDEILGKAPNFLLGPNSDRKQLEHLRECFERSVACEIEIVFYKKNREEFWVHVAMAPVADSAGNFAHFIAIGRDVTERVKNLAAIEEQKFKLSEIARIQSHEVRGPLARIKGLIGLLTDYSNLMTSKEIAEILHYLRLSSNEMDEVIKKIIANTEGIREHLNEEDEMLEGLSSKFKVL